MNWEQLLSLRRQGDKNKRLRNEQDETRLGFDVDYDRIIFSSAFRSLQDKTQVIPLSKTDFVHTFELLDDRFQRRKFIGAPASIPLVFTLNTEIRPSISQDRSKQARARPANRDNKETPVVVIVHRHNRN